MIKLNLYKYIILGLLLGCLGIQYSYAYDENSFAKDSLLFDESSDATRRVHFDALNYVNQKRYRPSYAGFKRGFFDNLYVGLYGGSFGILPRTGCRFRHGNEFSLSLTKFFTPYNGLRLSGSRNSMYRKGDHIHLLGYGASVDHIFNLTTYLSGFNPLRKFEFWTVEGLGYHQMRLGEEKVNAYDLHVGFQFKMHLGDRMDLFAEPRVSINSDNVDYSKKANWRKYDIGYAALVGLSCRLGTSFDELHCKNGWIKHFLDNTFVNFSGGMQVPLSKNTREMGVSRVLGPQVTASLGKWLSKSSALRLSIFTGYDGWMKNERDNRHDFLAAYVGSRVELMLNPFSMGHAKATWHKFSILPVGGLELGWALKQKGIERDLPYVGLTGALQFKYQLYSDISLFVEPRYSYIPYSSYLKNDLGHTKRIWRRDDIISLNFGVEMQHWSARVLPKALTSKENFIPHFSVSTGLGAAWALQQTRSADRRAGHLASLGLDYAFTPLSKVRIEGNVGTIFTRMANELRQVYVNLGLDYVFDVTNFMGGLDPERNFGAELFAGPMMGTVNQNPIDKRIFWGIEGGGRLSWYLTDRFDIYAEPRFRCYGNRVFPVGIGTPLIAAFNAGTVYHFKSGTARKRSLKDDDKYWFIGGSIGGANSYRHGYCALRGLPGVFYHSIGPEFSVNAGKWLTSFWGIRGSLVSSYYSYDMGRNGRPDKIVANFGGRLEGMFNPFRIGERRFFVELVPMGGIECGKLWREDGRIVDSEHYTALTFALQVKCNTNENVAFYAEPRIKRAPYSKSVSTIVNDNATSLSFGVEIKRTTRESMKQVRADRRNFKPYFYLAVGTGLSSQISPTRYFNLNFAPGAEFFAGYQFNPYSAFRVGGDYWSLPSKVNSDDKRSYVSVGLDYLWNVSRTFAGYDANHRLNLNLFVGPVVTWVNSDTYWGGEVGVQGNICLTPNWDLYLQPKARYYGNKNILPASFKQSSNTLFTFTVGTTYKF